ncbi:hypothetical protein KIK06_08745 [Nocardiopsis sp. EMB25]|uniref:hypothetical protein n=1 Tax=Nocardiopsis TaxID=2013 RepID=UPI000345E2AF|nr:MULTISPECIES: hypothetical protein [Nocardiopsis]MCY9783979.1 hypothetical protein [Nocardiopsis sp. EMB25]
MRRPYSTAGVLAVAAALTLGTVGPADAARGEIVFVTLNGGSVHRANPSGCVSVPDKAAGVVNSTNARIKVMGGSCHSADGRVVEAGKDDVVFPWERYVVVL